MTHSLTDKDLEKRTGTCSVCGPVKIAQSGNGWACYNRQRERTNRWKRKHPEHRKPSTNPHRLTDRKGGQATCAVCGPVAIVPWGRGYICKERATQLGRTRQQAAPAPYCQDCKDDDGKIIPLEDGHCPRCALTLNQMFANQRELAGQVEHFELDGAYTIVGDPDPYAMPDYESAVPGWKTIGSLTELVGTGASGSPTGT